MNLIPRNDIYQTKKSKTLKTSSGEDCHCLSDIQPCVCVGFCLFFKRWFFEDHKLPYLVHGEGKDTL